jgi:signal peptidase II
VGAKASNQDDHAGGLAPRQALIRAGALLALVAVLDQISKWVMVAELTARPRVIEVTGFFNLLLTHNTGISFGIFRGGDTWVRWALVVLALAIVGLLMHWLWREPRGRMALAVGLICGGAVGNVIDRIRIGAVVDFLDFHAAGWHWPAFNLADSAITLGVAVLLLDSLFRAPSGSRP